MKLVINNKNEILSYARTGGLANSIEFSGDLPIDFVAKFKPALYLWKSDGIVLNPDYVEPTTPFVGPSDTDKAIAQLTLQTARQKAQQDKLNAQLLLQIAQIKEEK